MSLTPTALSRLESGGEGDKVNAAISHAGAAGLGQDRGSIDPCDRVQMLPAPIGLWGTGGHRLVSRYRRWSSPTRTSRTPDPFEGALGRRLPRHREARHLRRVSPDAKLTKLCKRPKNQRYRRGIANVYPSRQPCRRPPTHLQHVALCTTVSKFFAGGLGTWLGKEGKRCKDELVQW